MDTEDNGRGPQGDENYVLGERDGVEVFLVVCSKQGPGTASEIEWERILSHSFTDVVKKLNSTDAGVICTESDYSKFCIIPEGEKMYRFFSDAGYDYSQRLFDGENRFLVYQFAGKDLLIAEINGELHIYGDGFEQFIIPEEE